MPIHEFLCSSCGKVSEHLIFGEHEKPRCPGCDADDLKKLLSVTSSASGVRNGSALPGAGDTACCGSTPGNSGCIPGSCCGRAH
ncbi:MAG TPA: FmdB family transcriptional regulator [Syntrophobacteraceae bacterium]|nr:FmdB family transcriptional regulator [Syntrophobacteraceae bacterium]